MIKKLTVVWHVKGNEYGPTLVEYYAAQTKKKPHKWQWKKGKALDMEEAAKTLGYVFDPKVRHNLPLTKEELAYVNLLSSEAEDIDWRPTDTTGDDYYAF